MIETQGIESKAVSQVSGVLGDKSGIEKDQFLQMLVAQLKYQDPLSPMKGTDFTAQLAQFASLEQLFKINENLLKVDSSQSQLANLQATSYIGRSVVTKGDTLTVSGGIVSPAEYRLEASAHEGNLTVYDAAGSIVRMIDLGSQEAGTYTVPWDGKDMNGNLAPDGEYKFQSNFYDEEGGYLPSEMYHSGTVQGISFESGSARLNVGGVLVSLDDVIQVN